MQDENAFSASRCLNLRLKYVSTCCCRAFGSYVELEIVVAENQVDAARTALLGLAAKLGLAEPERSSYLELILRDNPNNHERRA